MISHFSLFFSHSMVEVLYLSINTAVKTTEIIQHLGLEGYFQEEGKLPPQSPIPNI